MAKHNELGKKGESLALIFLKNKGYTILAQNWRYGRAEVDIIAQVEDIIVFVEVKTRSTDYFGYPEESVTAHKQQLMANAAEGYFDEFEIEAEVRFDIIAIIHNVRQTSIHHFEDAFFFYDE